MPPGPAADPYRVLGITPDASVTQLRVAWRRVVKTAHPDVGGDPATFRELQQAFALLSDPERRAAHDRERARTVGAAGAVTVDGSTGDASGGTERDPLAAAAAAAVRARWVGVERVWSLGATGAMPPVGGSAVVVDWPTVVRSSDPPVGSPLLTSIDPVVGLPRWSAQLAASVVCVVAGGGVVVAASADAVVHGLASATGVTVWERPLSTPVQCMAAVQTAVAGTDPTSPWVAIATGNVVTAVDGDGSARWATRLGHAPVWMQATSKALVVATAGDTVVALDPRTGRSRWWVRHRVDTVVAAAEVGGVVWIADREHHVVGLDLTTGSASHVVDVGEPVTGVHRVGSRLAIRTASAALVVLGPTGRPLWKVHLPGTFSAPVLTDGAVAVAVADGSMRLLSERTGVELHHVVVDLGPVHEPHSLEVHDPMVVVTAANGAVVGLRRTS